MSCILHLIWQPQSCIGERYINKRGHLQTCVFCYPLRYLIKNHLQMLTDIIWDLWGLFSHHTCYFGSSTREGRLRVAVDKIRQPFLCLKCLGEHLSVFIWARAWRQTCRSWLLSIRSPASLSPRSQFSDISRLIFYNLPKAEKMRKRSGFNRKSIE